MGQLDRTSHRLSIFSKKYDRIYGKRFPKSSSADNRESLVRADVIKSVKFSNDLCEDWELTVDLYCAQPSSLLSLTKTDGIRSENNTERIRNQPPKRTFSEPVAVSSRPKIIFNQELVSYCEATTDLAAYFRQRMRVSEGHTRGFRRGMSRIAESKILSLVDKMELFLNGLQYAKFIFVLGIGIINLILLLISLSSSYGYSQQLTNMFWISYSLQAANLAVALACIILATKICRPVRRYDIKDVLSLVAPSVITTPAFVIGSLRGFFRAKGTFYRTRRNLPEESKLSKPGILSESTASFHLLQVDSASIYTISRWSLEILLVANCGGGGAVVEEVGL